MPFPHLEATAEWCAATKRHETAVLLEAAALSQYLRVGMHEHEDAEQAVRFQISRSHFDAITCEQAQRVGEGLSYREALQQVRECLSFHTGVDGSEQITVRL